MREVFAEAISLVNLPFTVLLGLVMLYWLLVALGALDSHGGADAHADFHHDIHGDGHIDTHADGHLDSHAEGNGGGLMSGLLQFINLGEVPLMVLLSILSLCLWTCSLIANFYFTDHQAHLALAFLLPNLVVSAIVTRYLTLPLQPFFRMIRRAEGDFQPLVGRPCRITTSTANTTFGQAEVETNGAPLLIDVRTLDVISLPRGSNAVIFREDAERGVFFVVEVPNPQLP
jgi:hypothetical protein